MVEVHTLRDLESQAAPFPRAAVGAAGAVGAAAPAPRFLELLFPGFDRRTFIFGVSMVQIAVYVLCTIQSLWPATAGGASLMNKGASYGPPIIYGFEYWRLATPLFLHAGFMHILFNMFFQMRMGFALEHEYGSTVFALVYFTCGLIGNVFSLALQPCKVAVGASTAGFGLIGLQMAQILLTWHLLQRKDEIIFNIIFFFMLALLMSVGPDSVVDWRGHAGGFAAGFLWGLILKTDRALPPAWYDKYHANFIARTLITTLGLGSLAAFLAVPLSARGCGAGY